MFHHSTHNVSEIGQKVEKGVSNHQIVSTYPAIYRKTKQREPKKKQKNIQALVFKVTVYITVLLTKWNIYFLFTATRPTPEHLNNAYICVNKIKQFNYRARSFYPQNLSLVVSSTHS